jgi:hypothetical protein
VNNRVINRGPSVGFVENATRVRVQKMNIVERNIDTSAIARSETNVNRLEGNNLYIFRPNLSKNVNETHLVNEGRFEGNTAKIKNRDEVIQNQGDLQNVTNKSHSIFKMNPTENGNRNEVVLQNSPIKNNGRIKNQVNTKNTYDQQYSTRLSNNRWENPFIRENTTQSQHANIQTESRYPVYRNTERQFSRNPTRNTGILKQIPEVNNTYYPQMNQKPYYKINNNEQQLNQRNFSQFSNEGQTQNY